MANNSTLLNCLTETLPEDSLEEEAELDDLDPEEEPEEPEPEESEVGPEAALVAEAILEEQDEPVEASLLILALPSKSQAEESLFWPM